jgi:peptidoglycan/LPS O-acetylase OafA/YrhL
MMGWFKAKFDCTSAFAGYMTRSSYGIYIVHYLVIASLGYMMKMYTSLVPWMMYAILFFAVMLLSPAIYEILRRIPFVRWCVFGEKKKPLKTAKNFTEKEEKFPFLCKLLLLLRYRKGRKTSFSVP